MSAGFEEGSDVCRCRMLGVCEFIYVKKAVKENETSLFGPVEKTQSIRSQKSKGMLKRGG